MLRVTTLVRYQLETSNTAHHMPHLHVVLELHDPCLVSLCPCSCTSSERGSTRQLRALDCSLTTRHTSHATRHTSQVRRHMHAAGTTFCSRSAFFCRNRCTSISPACFSSLWRSTCVTSHPRTARHAPCHHHHHPITTTVILRLTGFPSASLTALPPP